MSANVVNKHTAPLRNRETKEESGQVAEATEEQKEERKLQTDTNLTTGGHFHRNHDAYANKTQQTHTGSSANPEQGRRWDLGHLGLRGVAGRLASRASDQCS